MKKFAVFGNPIKHSKSPLIHSIFAKKTGINNFFYEKKLIPLNKFKSKVNDFFLHQNGLGLNITLPFKKEAFFIADQLTDRAKISKSINTLKYNKKDNYILGDNTDGIGLIKDLKRLDMINKKDKILIIGAGGAAQSIIPSLIKENCFISIFNRTIKNAVNLVQLFNFYKKINFLEHHNINKYNFDLIINTSAQGILENKIELPENIVISKFTNCYDLCYIKNSDKTPFLKYCEKKRAQKISNGLGMLVYQAAYSFLFWNNILPDVHSVIKILKNSY